MAIEAPPLDGERDPFGENFCDGCGMPKNQCICDNDPEESDEFETSGLPCPECGYLLMFCECEDEE